MTARSATLPGMTERLSLDAAAHRLGVSVRTLRRRIHRGELVAEREETAQGFRYWITLDTEGAAASQQVHEPPGQVPDSALVEELRGERDRLWALVQEQQRTIGEQQETIAGLVRQHENAQVLIGQAQRLAQLPAAGQTAGPRPDADQTQGSQPASHVPDGTQSRQEGRRKAPLWRAILRRLLAGEGR